MPAQFESMPEATSRKPSEYSGFDGQFIGGSWRAGHRGKTISDTHPYTGETIAEIELADMRDLEEAYKSAANAQPGWAELLPEVREKIMLRSARIMEAQHDEIADWLVH